MRFIALKTENGRITGKIAFCCKALEVSRQGFYEYLKNKDKPWKYEELAAKMTEIREEDEYNDTYGKVRMCEALLMKKEKEGLEIEIPKERTIYRIMQKIGISHRPRKPKGLTKADKRAQKSDDLLKRNFTADEPNKKCVTDITELKSSDGKLYISAIFDCFDLLVRSCNGEKYESVSLYRNDFKRFETSSKTQRGNNSFRPWKSVHK